ncbi:hypothetical protein [Undibacterium jejuense]|uniref:hypothetical protein n=1 Tax=Undibacterium jejuense TaxID=1344949 RepID=UPI001C9A8529|nr:hypothetical protein [Undibacterium jejuense]
MSTLVMVNTAKLPASPRLQTSVYNSSKPSYHSRPNPELNKHVVHSESGNNTENNISVQADNIESQSSPQQNALTQQAHANAGKIFLELSQKERRSLYQLKPTTFEEKLAKDIQKSAMKDCQKDYADNRSTAVIISLTALVIYDTVTNKCKWR